MFVQARVEDKENVTILILIWDTSARALLVYLEADVRTVWSLHNKNLILILDVLTSELTRY